MEFKSVQKKLERTPEELARIHAIRERFQRDRPTVEQLLESGEYAEPVPLGVYLETKELLHRLKKEREDAGLTLSDVADRTGMDKGAISRLENGRQPNPTVETLARYATAIGKQIVWAFSDLPQAKGSKRNDEELGADPAHAQGDAERRR